MLDKMKGCKNFILAPGCDMPYDVPVENAISMVRALQKHKISYECHLFPGGPHGMSVCSSAVCHDPEAAYNARWVDMSIQWLYRLFDYKK